MCMIFFSLSFVYRLENQLEWGLLLKFLTWQQLLLPLQARQNLQLWPTGSKNQKRLYLILIHLVPWRTFVMWQKKIILCKWINYTISCNKVQGISHWTGRYELALTDRNMQVKSCLNIVLEFWDWNFFINILGFQKSNKSWPQPPPIKKGIRYLWKIGFLMILSTIRGQYWSF
jgi:hypothetical protein